MWKMLEENDAITDLITWWWCTVSNRRNVFRIWICKVKKLMRRYTSERFYQKCHCQGHISHTFVTCDKAYDILGVTCKGWESWLKTVTQWYRISQPMITYKMGFCLGLLVSVYRPWLECNDFRYQVLYINVFSLVYKHLIYRAMKTTYATCRILACLFYF